MKRWFKRASIAFIIALVVILILPIFIQATTYPDDSVDDSKRTIDMNGVSKSILVIELDTATDSVLSLVTTAGKTEAWYEPDSMLAGATLEDRIAGDNDGTIIWGNNEDLTVVFGAMESSGSVTASTQASYFDLSLATMPDTWFAGGEDLSDLPFYDWFSDISSQTGVPVQTMYFWVILGIAFAAFIGLVVFTRSAFIGVLAMVIVLVIGSSMTIVPMWLVFVVLIVDIGIMYLYKQVSY